MDKPNHFKIIDCGDNFVVANIKGEYENHTHLKKENTANLLIRLVCKKVVPNSPYMRESAKRISRDKRYIQNIEVKIEKDKNKQKFTRINKGIPRKFY